ncbi:MAG: hypothetical protein Q7T61_13950 [Caulobacter sp.]|nr:hypothetical protein [Caulobacter sp.]
MTDPLMPLRWIIGGRRVEARSVLPVEIITTVVRAHGNAPFETPARDRIYRLSGWASAKAGAVRIVRKGMLPFTPVLNIRFSPQDRGSAVVFSEGLLLNSWFVLLFYSGAAAVVLATSGGHLEPRVMLGLLVGLGLFLANRWIARHDFDLLLDHMMTLTGSLPVEEWALETVARPIVEPGRTFGRRRV